MKSAVILAMLLSVPPAAAQTASPQPPYQIGSWAKLPSQDRKSTIVAAIEGLLLAATGPVGGAPRISQDCLAQVNVESIERSMASKAASNPKAAFVPTFLEASKCSHS